MKINIPEGYNRVMTYLILGDLEKFLSFTTTVFDATEKMKHKQDNELSHVEILIGDTCIMAGKAGEQWAVMNAGLFIYVEDADASFQKAKNAGASVVMELSDQSYGRTCGVKDPCGNVWWITSVKE